MKRLPAVFLAAALVFSLACCSMPPSSAPAETPAVTPEAETELPPVEETALSVIVCRHGDVLDEWFTGFVERFESANPNVRLRLELVSPEEGPALVAERVAAGEAPDIVCADDVSACVSDELLLPAAEYCPEELYADFFSPFLDTEDGGVWALPDLVSVRTLYYNTELLEQAGLEAPATRAELEEACQAIVDYYEGAVCPFGLSLTEDESAACFACFAWSGGGGFVDESGAWALNSAENAAAVRFAVGLTDKGFTNGNPAAETAEELRARFAEGTLAMLLTDEEPDSAIGAAALIPAGEGGKACAVAGTSRLAVLRNGGTGEADARREAVGQFLLSYYDPGNYAERARLAGRLCASRSAAERLAALDPSGAARPGILENCRLLPTGRPGWDAVCAGLYSVEQLSLIGGDVQGALDALQGSLADAA